MSQYNKTVLTNAGLELAKRANAGQAKFEITRAVTSADDWSNKTIQDIEAVTAIPNIMQQGTIRDTEEVESNNSVIGVSLCFANKDLSAGYQIKIIGVYVKEEGQDKDFLYAVTTAVTPEYMPDFSDGVLYRFNMQMYLVIGKAQAVNVVINDGASVTHGQFDKYKSEVTADLKKIENAHKEDMGHVVKSASINGGNEVLPDEAGKLELVVPAPDLSKYVSLEQLTETLKTKADITAIPDKTATEEGIKQAKELAQEADTKAQNALDNKADKTTVEGNLTTKANQSDLDQTNAEVAKKANSSDVTSLQNTVGGLTESVSSLQSDDTTNKQNISSLQQNANGLTSTVTSLQTQVNNSAVGTNLVIGTDQEYVMGYGIPNTVWQDGYAYEKLPTTILDVEILPQVSHSFCYILAQGTTYTQTIWLETDATVKDLSAAQITWYTAGANHDPQPTTLVNLGGNKYKLYSTYTWPGKSDNNVRLFDIQNLTSIFDLSTGTYLKFGNLKLEKGSHSTDWSLNPSEISTQPDIASLQNTINQQNQTIQSLTTRVTNLENEISYIKANYIEGKQFPASQEAQAVAWENANPQGIAFITSN